MSGRRSPCRTGVADANLERGYHDVIGDMLIIILDPLVKAVVTRGFLGSRILKGMVLG